MKHICTLCLISLLLISLPVLGICATWSDVRGGLAGSNVYSGDGVYATKTGNTVTITGGTLSNFHSNMKGVTEYYIDSTTLTGSTLITNEYDASQVNFNNSDINGSDLAVIAYPYSSSPALDVNYSGNAKFTNGVYITSRDNAVVRFKNSGNLSVDSTDTPFIIEQVGNSKVSFKNQGNISVISYDSPSVPTIDIRIDAPLSDLGAYEAIINDLHITGVDNANIRFLTSDVDVVAEFENYPSDPTLKHLLQQSQPQQPSEEPDWEPSRQEIKAHEMEEKRQAASAGNVMGSPWPCYQLNLNYASRNLWVRGKDGEKIFHTSYVNWLGTGRDAAKNLTLKVQLDKMNGVNIRYDRTVLEVFDRCGITQITVINDYNEVYMIYSVAAMRAAHEAAGLHRREILVIGGPEDEIMTCGDDHNSTPVPVVFPEPEAASAGNP